MEKKPFRMLRSKRLDPQTLRVLSDPLRSFIVYSLVPKAKTVRQLAAEVECPPTRLYHHMQLLQKHGLIDVVETRIVSGIIEKHYRATARDFLLDRSKLSATSTAKRGNVDALLSFVFDQTRQEVLRQVQRGLIDLSQRPPETGSLIAYRNVLRLDDAQATRLYQRLHAFWLEYEAAAKSPAENGRFYAFAVALYPNSIQAEAEPLPEARRKRRTKE